MEIRISTEGVHIFLDSTIAENVLFLCKMGKGLLNIQHPGTAIIFAEFIVEERKLRFN